MKRAPNQPTSALTMYGGIFALTWTVRDAGTICPQHAHVFDHLSAIMHGAVRVDADGVDLGEFRAPAFIKIAARTRHTFTTTEPDTVIACLHATDVADDDALIHERHDLVSEDI